jgi:serine/threonine protein kinase
MNWVAVACPQCGAPLPRLALWRAVNCRACGSLIVKRESLVKREDFRQALVRARHDAGAAHHSMQCGGASYALLQSLGHGEISQVHLARRVGAFPLLVTIKLSSASTAARRYAQEAAVLRELQATDGGTAAYFSQRLPEVVAQGCVDDRPDRQALVLRHPNGFWGSLAALNEAFPAGLDPRHAVWIWRRLLEVLGFIHDHGWCHGDVRPEHALVHPQDHGVNLIGWAAARKGASAQDQAGDLTRSARVVSVLLSGASERGGVPSHVPADLAQLVARAAAGADFCRSQRAHGLDAALRAAARAAYGPPSFLPLTL